MSQQIELEQALRRVLFELGPYLPDVVLIGGWVPYLYRHYGRFGAWAGTDTFTRELDVLVDRPLPRDGRPPLAELLRNSGFRPDREGASAAVWVRGAHAGEKIEFIAPHRGTARGQGNSVPVEEQSGLGAIPLTEVELLLAHAQALQLPGAVGMPSVEVRVPTLGAYVVTKALTFIARGARTDEDGAPKLVKDLLYLRDLMAAGEEVVTSIEGDIDEIAGGSRGDADRIRTAATNLGFVIDGKMKYRLIDVARMLVERGNAGSLEQETAAADGYLTDLYELLAEAADRYAPLPLEDFEEAE
ncbi:MAG TPA: GSU2403 family nucleotidyltransferase fold protein [Longimicrobium sp.]|jgi:hypothetical protein|nr:GSU2403 family nucleotidyltransferase fold protein [Longimicrobium sp.]